MRVFPDDHHLQQLLVANFATGRDFLPDAQHVTVKIGQQRRRGTWTQPSAMRVRYSAVNGPRYDSVPDAITMSPMYIGFRVGVFGGGGGDGGDGGRL